MTPASLYVLSASAYLTGPTAYSSQHCLPCPQPLSPPYPHRVPVGPRHVLLPRRSYSAAHHSPPAPKQSHAEPPVAKRPEKDNHPKGDTSSVIMVSKAVNPWQLDCGLMETSPRFPLTPRIAQTPQSSPRPSTSPFPLTSLSSPPIRGSPSSRVHIRPSLPRRALPEQPDYLHRHEAFLPSSVLIRPPTPQSSFLACFVSDSCRTDVPWR